MRQTFLKCRKYRLSLNPKKSYFAMEEGKLLGHIVSKEGVKIDPERVVAIQQVGIPRHKEVQSFLGKIIFLRRFISNFAEIVRVIINMLKKGHEISWSSEARQPFQQIKNVLGKSQVLLSPNYTKDFLIFSFASINTIVVVLLQKNDEGHE